MSRRYSLLASLSNDSGGGKLVNIITLKPYIYRGSLNIDHNSLFPVTSDIRIDISTNGFEGQCSIPIEEGTSGRLHNDVDLGPSTPEITVNSITPNEDDNYIYEVVIEY